MRNKMNELAVMIQDLTAIAKMGDVDMRTELSFYVRDLERKFELLEQDLERELDNVPV
jgi:outer membrane murein-binding lipoprotein Lpp